MRLATCCLDLCKPEESPRIDDVAIIPAGLSSPEAIHDYERLLGRLEGVHLASGLLSPSVLMDTFETLYNLNASNMHNVFQKLLAVYSGDREDVRLFTRLHYSECKLRRCQFFRKRYDWVKRRPAEWTEFHLSEEVRQGWGGSQFAELHIPEAITRHTEELTEELR